MSHIDSQIKICYEENIPHKVDSLGVDILRQEGCQHLGDVLIPGAQRHGLSVQVEGARHDQHRDLGSLGLGPGIHFDQNSLAAQGSTFVSH